MNTSESPIIVRNLREILANAWNHCREHGSNMVMVVFTNALKEGVHGLMGTCLFERDYAVSPELMTFIKNHDGLLDQIAAENTYYQRHDLVINGPDLMLLILHYNIDEVMFDSCAKELTNFHF